MGSLSLLFLPNAGTFLCHLHFLKPCSMAESVDSNDCPPCCWIGSLFSCSSFYVVIVIYLLYGPTNALYIYFFIFFFITSSACSITVSNTTCYRSLPFLLIVLIYILFIFSRSIELIYLSNCFKYLFVSSLLLTGHLSTFNPLNTELNPICQ